MAIQNIISNIVQNMDANTDSFDFTFETDSWKNLNLDEQPLPSVHLMMPLRGKPKMQTGGSFDYEYACILSFMYASELDDTPEAHELNLMKAENALSQFILMLQKDTDNVDSSKTLFGDFLQFTAHRMYDRCVDGVTIEIKITPKQRPAACVPSYSVPVGDCDPATYLVQYIDETLIQSGAVASGGSITVNVPMPLYWELNYNGTDDVISIPCTINNAGTFASGNGSNIGTITVSTDGVTFGSISYPFTAVIGTTYFFKRSTATNSGTFTLTGSYA